MHIKGGQNGPALDILLAMQGLAPVRCCMKGKAWSSLPHQQRRNNMEEIDEAVVRRLAAFEAAGQISTPPEVRQTRGRRAWPIVLGPVLAFAIVGSAVGAVLVTNLVIPRASIEDSGQPLAGAQLECMSPLEALRFLEGRGFADVVWQVERDSWTTVESGSTLSDDGYVIPGSILSDGRLHMIVDARTGATPVGACSGKIR